MTTQFRLAFPTFGTVRAGGTTEVVDFTGDIFFTAILPPNPIVPTDPYACRFTTNLVNVRGVGRESGFSYQVTGAGAVSQACASPGTSFRLAFRLHPTDPFYPVDPYRFSSVALNFSVLIDEQGNVTDAVAAVAPIVEG